jgi:hypothetical protein
MGNHMLLTIGALLLFGTFMLTANGLMSDNKISAEQNEYAMTAISLAQSVIDEAKNKAFDEAIALNPNGTFTTSDMSTTLGRESGESVPSPDTLTSDG